MHSVFTTLECDANIQISYKFLTVKGGNLWKQQLSCCMPGRKADATFEISDSGLNNGYIMIIFAHFLRL